MKDANSLLYSITIIICLVVCCANAFTTSNTKRFAVVAPQQKHHTSSSTCNYACFSIIDDTRITSIQNIRRYSTKLCATSEDEEESKSTQEKYATTFNMASLQRRIHELQNQDAVRTQPLVVLDAMLPRQVMELKVENEMLTTLVRTQLELQDVPSFGMLGMATLRSGQRVHLNRGVEVEILKAEFDDSANGGGGGSGVSVILRGTRRFEIVPNSVSTVEQGWTTAQIKYLDHHYDANASSNSAESIGFDMNDESLGTDHEDEELLESLSRAKDKAKELIGDSDVAIEGSNAGVNRIDQWIELARENERQPNQIDLLLKDLGEMPGVHRPTDLAFWIGALINPLPAMGVAMEVRPALLMADTAEERMEIASDAMVRSIRHMNGSQRMW
mmetsp:Transcript_17543/g.27325  ORF Transcript_17543/g.27325 Transcript_17543/m.27325 type:complete len:388 (+) Transcript_17543:97-1260(+)